jgi:hypothetical protein
MAKRKAYKSTFDGIKVLGDENAGQASATVHPVNKDNSAIFYKIDVINKEVATVDGTMAEVKLKFVGKDENVDPNWDVAAVVGVVIEDDSKSSVNRPEVVFWEDELWLKATDKVGVEYYSKDKTYLLYPVQVQNQDLLFDNLSV